MSHRRCLPAFCIALGLLLLPLDAALADKRVALLIGNSSYRGVTALENPPRDVAALGAALTSAGFDKVETRIDLDRDAMVKALRSFEDVSADADIAVIYFSGHGLEMNGENFLVPIDAKLAADRDVEDETVTLSRMLRTVDGAKRLKLIILDACRNNPFLASMAHQRSTKSVSRGLVEVEPRSADTLIAYAAKAGTVAWDGAGDSSPFAQSLAKRLVEPGIDIRIALGKVRDDVLASTSSLQEPFAYGSLGGTTVSLAIAPPSPTPASVAPPTTVTATGSCGDAAAHWAEASRFDRLDFYKKHVELFGTCAFGDFARAKVLELEGQTGHSIQQASVDTDTNAVLPRQTGETTAAETPAPGASSSKAAASKLSKAKASAARSQTDKRQATRAAKPAPQQKQTRRTRPSPQPVGEADYAMAREPVDMDPGPRSRPPLLLGFGRRGHGGIGFGGIGLGW